MGESERTRGGACGNTGECSVFEGELCADGAREGGDGLGIRRERLELTRERGRLVGERPEFCRERGRGEGGRDVGRD